MGWGLRNAAPRRGGGGGVRERGHPRLRLRRSLGYFAMGGVDSLMAGAQRTAKALRACEREVPPPLMSSRTPLIRGGGGLGKGSGSECERRFLRKGCGRDSPCVRFERSFELAM